MNMNRIINLITFLVFSNVIFYISCNSDEDKNVKVISVNPAHFITSNLIGDIEQKTVRLKGVKTLCYVIKSNSQATEHEIGPWCPDHLDDKKEKGGIWFKDGKVYDVSGHFIAELAEFYNDKKWKLYRKDGSIKVTKTKEGCLGAAKPNVEREYKIIA